METTISLEEYKVGFLSHRKKFATKTPSELNTLQEEWTNKARDMLSGDQIRSFLTQINRETCVSRDALQEIAMEIETIVGDNPLLYAASLRTFATAKLYLQELLTKVQKRKKHS